VITPLTIRRAAPDDLVPVTALLRELGYPAEAERVAPTLRQLLDDPGASVLIATEDGRGVVGLLSLSCRPVLRLQGIAGTIEELVVRRDARSRGVGDRLLQHAKGIAAGRGWIRLEIPVARLRDANRNVFFADRGFGPADSVIYRWARLEGSHPALPALTHARHREIA
jgi:GNAT superfamily N-acetyltransferase